MSRLTRLWLLLACVATVAGIVLLSLDAPERAPRTQASDVPSTTTRPLAETVTADSEKNEPDRDKRTSKESSVRVLAKEWAAALLSNQPGAVEVVAKALASDTPQDRMAGLRAILRARTALRGNIVLRPLVVSALKDSVEEVVRLALLALPIVGSGRELVGSVMTIANHSSAELRAKVVNTVGALVRRKFEARDNDMVLRLLRDKDDRVVSGSVDGLSTARWTPEIETELIRLATESPATGAFACLCTSKMKTQRVLELMLSRFDEHVVPGLRRGVPAEKRTWLAGRLASKLEPGLAVRETIELLQLVQRYGGPAEADAIERMAQTETRDAVRDQFLLAVKSMRLQWR